ncbi:STAS domain-containing protein [Streptosporangium sp. NBC_01639]|uniref:STAS domain-containing protein n=1 Tax=Streptosporangium sp. NBC_01639 TaxID=2975948 RepID=UPI00386E7A57|nr:STAS domain-containing protein [Streptosporangium sp. NBC_01639]
MLSVPAKTPTDSNSPALPRSAHTVVRLCGDIDITSSPALRERLLVSLRSSTDLLVLDLSEASFHDPSGPAVLIGVQRRARPLGITVVLTSPRPQTTELLHVTGLERCLTIRPTLRDALGSGYVPAPREQPDTGRPDKEAGLKGRPTVSVPKTTWTA